jgi:hypothetical protein
MSGFLLPGGNTMKITHLTTELRDHRPTLANRVAASWNVDIEVTQT